MLVLPEKIQCRTSDDPNPTGAVCANRADLVVTRSQGQGFVNENLPVPSKQLMFERDPKVSFAILRHSAESGDGKLRTVGAAKRVPVEAIKARQAPDRGDPKIAIVTLQNSKDAVVRQPMLARPPLPGIIMRQRRVLRKRVGRSVAVRCHCKADAGQQQTRNA